MYDIQTYIVGLLPNYQEPRLIALFDENKLSEQIFFI